MIASLLTKRARLNLRIKKEPSFRGDFIIACPGGRCQGEKRINLPGTGIERCGGFALAALINKGLYIARAGDILWP
ncbi:MAG: galactokinase family protein [Provencibacterium sp.]|nr:galactokinase family protein [Provencibacterium sp.]